MKNAQSKVVFKETTYHLTKKVPYYILEEGIGLNGSYDVDAEISVRKQNDTYIATITGSARTDSGKNGKVIFSCIANMYVNGSKKDSKKLQGGDREVQNATIARLGATSFVLPIWDSYVEIELEVGYLLYTLTGMHGATNKVGNWLSRNDWKKVGNFFGAIRQKLLVL